MSFSFQVKATSGVDALRQVSERLAEVTAAQPVHEADIQLIEALAMNYIVFAGEPAEGSVLQVSVGGSIWFRDGVLGQATANIGVTFVAAA